MDLLLTEGIGVEDYQEIKKECDHQISSLNNMLNGLADMREATTQLLNHRGNKFLNLTLPLPKWRMKDVH